MIDSLLANNIFLLFFIIFKVGMRPAIPGMAAIVISELLKFLILLSRFL